MAEVAAAQRYETKIDEAYLADYKPYSTHNNPLLTDLYQITMAYAYWKNSTPETHAVFDLFFRKCPFKGEFCVFAGLDDILRFLNNFKFDPEYIELLKQKFPDWNTKFWDYLLQMNLTKLQLYAMKEGTVVFPRTPLVRVEGPLAVCQLIETPLLNMVNFSSLITTNAARMRIAAGLNKNLLEFGLRRAQGPDGGMSASRFAYMGGFDGTSNVLAGLDYNITIKGTHAHSFVTSFSSLKDIQYTNDALNKGDQNFIERCETWLKQINGHASTNMGELAAFISYANAFPKGFLALVDTYHTLNSGVINFLAVALALDDCGFKPIGIRLDSGDLAFLSKRCRAKFVEVADKFNRPYFKKLTIVASNDIDERILYALREQHHEVDSFGIGTHLVTCKMQPALGCVYKLVEFDTKPRIKASQQAPEKMTIPGRKQVWRLHSKTGEAVLDLMKLDKPDNAALQSNLELETILRCYHPFDDIHRVDVRPSKMEELLIKVFDGKVVYKSPSLDDRRKFCMDQVSQLREDYTRPLNPTPYKVSISGGLRKVMKDLIEDEITVAIIE